MPFGPRRANVRKLADDLATRLELGELEAECPIIVRFRNHEACAKTLSAGPADAQRFRLTPTAAFKVSPEDVIDLSHLPEVAMIWPDKVMHTCLDTSVPFIGAPLVWREGFTGKGIKIAVVDTGIDVNHPDLAGKVAATKDVTGEGFSDLSGHGTHVAGIIAGSGEKYRGVASGASLVGIKVLRGNGFGMMSWVIAGVEWALDNGAHIINLSLGSSGDSDGKDALSQTCNAVVDRGIVVCAAAGNEGPGAGTIGSPGGAPKVITIGACNETDQVADFSSRGPTADGRTKPDLLFPGYAIVSCRAKGTSMGQVVDELYTSASGTSMATPHASAAAALLLEARPELRPLQMKLLLQRTAKNLGLSKNIQGAGRARLDEAYRRLLETAPQPSPEPEQPSPLPAPPVGRIGCLTPIPRFLWRGTRGPAR